MVLAISSITIGDMEVNSRAISAELAAERARIRHQDDALATDDIRRRLQRLTASHEKFERTVERDLEVDAAGLATMDLLITRGPATPTELARAVEISTAAMTLVLNRLEASGHITRESHPTDRRKVVVTATEASTIRAHDSFQPLLRGVDTLVDSMGNDERLAVATFLAELLAIYDEAISASTRR